MSWSWVFPFKHSELLLAVGLVLLCANSASFSCSCVTRPPEPVYSTVNKLGDKPASPRHYSPVECDKSFLLSAPYPHYHLGLLPDSDMTRYCMCFLSSPPVACASTRLGGWNSPPLTRFCAQHLPCGEMFGFHGTMGEVENMAFMIFLAAVLTKLFQTWSCRAPCV